jgi:uncharacterized protein (DUF305 family)
MIKIMSKAEAPGAGPDVVEAADEHGAGLPADEHAASLPADEHAASLPADEFGGPGGPDDESAGPVGSGGWRRWLPVALAAVVALLIGYGVGVWQPRLTAPGDTSAEAGFARDMSEHHAQAVELGMIAYQRATDPEVRVLGGDIATTQQAQIGMMSTWLKNWRLLPTGSEPHMAWMPDGERALSATGMMPGMATPEEMAKLHKATGKDVDILVLQYMLRHHLGGIHMVDGVLAETSNPDVRELAQAMRDGQAHEVKVLTDLLTRLGAKPLGS